MNEFFYLLTLHKEFQCSLRHQRHTQTQMTVIGQYETIVTWCRRWRIQRCAASGTMYPRPMCPLTKILAYIVPCTICPLHKSSQNTSVRDATYKGPYYPRGNIVLGRNVLGLFVSGHIGRGHTVTSFVTSIIQFINTIVPKLRTSSSVYAVETRHVSINRGDLQISFM